MVQFERQEDNLSTVQSERPEDDLGTCQSECQDGCLRYMSICAPENASGTW
jgi:hypothetical protein